VWTISLDERRPEPLERNKFHELHRSHTKSRGRKEIFHESSPGCLAHNGHSGIGSDTGRVAAQKDSCSQAVAQLDKRLEELRAEMNKIEAQLNDTGANMIWNP
jgi:hypothetical protein